MKRYLLLGMALLLALSASGCAEPAAMEIPELLEPVDSQMDLAEAVMDTVYTLTSIDGQIVPHVEQLQFAVGGTLDQFTVSIGDYVTKDQVVAQLREDQIREQMSALSKEKTHIKQLGKLSDKQLEVEISIAKTELSQLQTLNAPAYECSVKEVDIQKLQQQLEQAKELRSIQIQELDRKWLLLNDQLKNTKITAPCDGRVVYIASIRSGGAVQPFTTVLCIADESRLKLQTEFMPEAVITKADKVFAKVGALELPVTYIPYDSQELLFHMLSEDQTNTYFDFGENRALVESGQFAVLQLLNSYKENVLTIPANALYRGGTSPYVYKVVDGQRIRCDVTVGIISDTRAEIRAGLQEGDLVYVKN